MDKFTIFGKIGQGGMGKVYKAQDSLQRIVALKTLLVQSSNDQQYLKRFLNEGKAIAQLNHPNIVSIYEIGVYNATPIYMPPEQFKGRGVDHRADLYSLGVILYEIYANKNPFAGKSTANTITKILMDTIKLS